MTVALAGCLVLASARPTRAEGIAPKAERGPRDFVLAAAGDIAYPRGRMDRLVDGQGEHLFDFVRPLLRSADLAFANLESPYTEAPYTVTKRWPIATPPRRLQYVLSAGFNVFSLANNHVFDCGMPGIRDTLALLERTREERGFLAWAGVASTRERAYEPVVFTVPGKRVRVALLAFGHGHTKLVPVPHGRAALRAIRRARRIADVVVVSVHLGKEYEHMPSPQRAALYRRYVDAGADVVLGHHPHVIQGVEVYRHSIIFYSLGNFSFASKTVRHHQTGARLYGMLPLLVFEKGKLRRAVIVPLYVNNLENLTVAGQVLRHTNFKPQVLQGVFAQHVLGEIRGFTEAIPGVSDEAVRRFRIHGDRAVVVVR